MGRADYISAGKREVRAEMSQKARKTAEEYSEDFIAELAENYYADCISKSRNKFEQKVFVPFFR